MGEGLDIKTVTNNKTIAVKDINNLMEKLIKSGKEEQIKKANLLAYWLKAYSNYIDFEDKFDSKRMISYNRGDVIRLNFGFNVGKEFGGLHFAVVLDNDSKQCADVVTVVPLSSTDGKKVHHRNVDLGVELYEKINTTQITLLKSAKDNLDEIVEMKNTWEAAIEYLNANGIEESKMDEKFNSILTYQETIDERMKIVGEEIERIKRNNAEISKLKKGSMAVVNQITTVSKQRIYTPKKTHDFLYGIGLSTPAMEKINNKIKELYCR